MNVPWWLGWLTIVVILVLILVDKRWPRTRPYVIVSISLLTALSLFMTVKILCKVWTG